LEYQPVGVGDGGKVEGDSADHTRPIGVREPFTQAFKGLSATHLYLLVASGPLALDNQIMPCDLAADVCRVIAIKIKSTTDEPGR
jgi:hypothetical protein